MSLASSVKRYLLPSATLVFGAILLLFSSGSPQLPVLVKNRVEAIRAVPHLTYQYVKSCDNPADLPSRGATVSTLQSSNLWWHGPAFLSVSSDQPVILAVGGGGGGVGGGDPTETTPESSKESRKISAGTDQKIRMHITNKKMRCITLWY